MMFAIKVYKWCAKHKIWTFWIVVVLLLVSFYIDNPNDSMLIDGSYGEGIAIVFWAYLLTIWLYSLVRKGYLKWRGSK